MAAESSKAEKSHLEPPPNYADRSTQWRLMGIVGMVMCAVFLVKYGFISDLWGLVSGNPDTWAQFSGRTAEVSVDTRLPRTTADESPLAEPSIDAAGGSRPVKTVAPAKTANTDPAKGPLPPDPGWLPGLDPESLKVVEDDTVIRGKENDAWYGLCALVAKTAPETLAKLSLGPTRFVQIFRQSGYYRGKVVTISGKIRTAEPLEASKNAHEVTSYTKCVLFPNDGSNSPIVIYVMEMPAGFPATGPYDEAVTIDAVSYKRYAYMAQDVPRTAPLLVARSFAWSPPVPKAPEEVPWITLSVLVVISAVLGVTIAIVALRRLNPRNEDMPAELSEMPKEK